MKNFSILLSAFIVLTFTQCKQDPSVRFKSKGGLRVILKLDESTISPTNQEEILKIREKTVNILNNRLNYFGVAPHIEWLEAENLLRMEIPEVKNSLAIHQLLETNAELEFRETMVLSDAKNLFTEADKRLTNILVSDIDKEAKKKTSQLQYPLLSKLFINQGYSGPIVGYVHQKDTNKVTEYLNRMEIKSQFPEELTFKWSAKPMMNSTEYYELYTIKRINQQNLVLKGDAITKAFVDVDNFQQPAISIIMNEAGSKMWEQLTGLNVGNAIAILLNHEVYSAPFVSEKITGNNCTIAGQFDSEEVQILVPLLNFAQLPVGVKIIQEEVISKP